MKTNTKQMTRTQQIIVAVFSLIILGLVLVLAVGQHTGIRPIARLSWTISQVFSIQGMSGIVREPQCSDGQDNDNDGARDYPADFSCSNENDNDEQQPWSECFDGEDNDEDGPIDMADTESCSGIQDNSESSPQCSDGRDNDDDNLVDFPADLGCTSRSDDEEFNATTQSNVIQPGTTGWGSTQLTASGSGAKAIARWDVVPYQTITGELNVGVIAFHKNGIDRVEFYADGGSPAVATEMTLNPITGVWEYVGILRADNYQNSGPTELRAIVYPNNGAPRILQNSSGQDLGDKSLPLVINKNNSLSSNTVNVSASTGQTIATAVNQLRGMPNQCSGATIRLSAGTYMFEDMGGVVCDASRWVTIEPAAGATQAQVIIVPNPALPSYQRTNVLPKLRLRNVTVRTNSLNYVYPYNPQTTERLVWFDNVKIEGTGFFGTTPANSTSKSTTLTDSGNPRMFYSDVQISNTAAPEFGTDSTILMRNVKGRDIGTDFSNSKTLMVNIEMDHLKSRHDLGSHPDFIQTTARDIRYAPPLNLDNMIVYNVKGIDIGAQTAIGANTMKNVALVNFQTSKHIGDPQVALWMPGAVDNGETDHILFWGVGIYNGVLVVNRGNQTNIDFKGSFVEKMMHDGNNHNISGWTGAYNHFMDSLSWAALTVGTPVYNGGSLSSLFRDHENQDFHPSSGSALGNKISNLFIPADIDGRERESSTAIGPYRGQSEGSNPVVNKRPMVNLGEDFPEVQAPALPFTKQITSTVVDDGRSGSPLSYSWQNIDGATMTIASPNAANTNMTFPTYGKYPVQLRVSDGQLSGNDEAMLWVVPRAIISSPATDTNVSGTVNIQMSSPSPSVTALRILVNGTVRRTCTGVPTCSFSWNASAETAQWRHTISAQASAGGTPEIVGTTNHYVYVQ